MIQQHDAFFRWDPQEKGGGGGVCVCVCGLTNLVPRPDFHSYAVAMTEGTVQLVSMDLPPPPPPPPYKTAKNQYTVM